MQVGVALPSAIPGAEGPVIIQWAARADAGPFSHLATVDRVKYDSYEPFTTLGAAAAVTKRVRLATTILIAPLRNTPLLGKQAASLDRLSGGRFILGVGVGARTDDYEVTGVEHATRGRRLSEQLADLKLQWEGGVIGPAPTGASGPQILVGGGSGPTFARMARYADGYIHGGGPPRVFARAADQARAAWADAGRPGQPPLWGQGYFALGDPETVRAGMDYLRHYYAFTGPFAERLAAGLLTSPQAINDYIQGYAEAGCDELSLLPAVPRLDQLDRLAELVGALGRRQEA